MAVGDLQARDLLLDLRRIFDLSADLMCIADRQGRFRMVSASVTKILGYDPDELVGRRFLEFVHPDDVQRTAQAHESIVGGASVVEFENRYRRKDGASIDLSWSAAWSPDASMSYSVGRDVTNRKRAAARLELAQSIARLGYWEHDLVTGSICAYGEACAILGLPEHQTIDLGMLIDRVVEEDRHTICEETHPGYLSSELQFRVRREDGSLRHVYAQRRAIRDAGGKAIRIISTLQDVTERHDADLERQRYLGQLASLADAARKVNSILTIEELLQVITDIARDLVDAHVAVSIISRDGGTGAGLHSSSHSAKYSSVVPSMLAVLDVDSEPLRPTPPVRVPRVHDNEQPADAQKALALSGVLSVSLVSAAGLRAGSIVVADKREGDFTQNDARVLVQLADLAAVGLENARLYAELEARVRRRTQELEQSNRELEAFSYSVSHDLRGPLRAIAGFTGLLRDRHYETIDADSRRYIDRVLAGTQRMSSLIDDLLELGRVTRVEIKRELVDLSALAQAIMAHLRERAPERVATIAIAPDQKVHGDLRLMEIALENLLSNAWKFTSSRPVAEIRFGSVMDERGEPAFFVQDNGVGFDPRYAANLFGVFQRLHAASEFPGTGVGLATVQRIVQRHGGRIWAQAETDRGATFYFTMARE